MNQGGDAPIVRRPERRSPSGADHLGATPTPTALEQWLLKRVAADKRRIVVLASVVAVAISTVLTSVSLYFGEVERDVVIIALCLSVLCPSVIAPPLLWYFARVVAWLDELSESLRIMATVDPLTNTLNRRGFFAYLAEVAESGSGVQVAMVDIDDFKVLNDRRGHDFGDEVLREVARWLLDVVGNDGAVGRLGGDEFACISARPLASLAQSRRSLDVGGVAVRISIGVDWCESSTDIDDALVRADAALYRAKRDKPATVEVQFVRG